MKFLLLFLLAPPSFALPWSSLLGREAVPHSEGRSPTLCSLPLHPFADAYSAKDTEKERELCGFEADRDVAVCPKTNSTNPGLLFVAPAPGMTVAELTAKECEAEGAKKEAKLKLSISCSYAPAIAAYYHFSRWLGGTVNVPVAVLRSYARERHRALALRAEKLLASRHEEAIYRWWMKLKEQLFLPRGENPLLFNESFTQTVGTLQANPKGEAWYRELNDRGEDRVRSFQEHNPIYARLTRRDPLPRALTAANLQLARNLKDTADFLLLDTLLNQQDRFGNVAFVPRYYYQDGGKLRAESKLEKVPEPFRSRALTNKEVMLKDNDCAVAKEPRIRDAHLLDAIAHIDPRSYAGLLRLEAAVDTAPLKEFLVRGLLFTEADYQSVRSNVHFAASLLRTRCERGQLALDLDLDRIFSTDTLPGRYECAAGLR